MSYDNLPDFPAIEYLKSHSKWVAWKYVERGEGVKPTKVPVNPHTGGNASVSRSGTWGSYEEAVEAAQGRGLAGVGFVLTGDGEITGADLDDVRNPETGEIVGWALEIVQIGETYAEVSPSGRGLRFFWRGKSKTIKKDKYSVEIYSSGRYLTITGNHLAGTPEEIRAAPRTEAALIARALGGGNGIGDFTVPAHLSGYESKGLGASLVDDAFRTRWQVLNDEALLNLDMWVPALFGDKAVRTDDGRYRVSSKSLGRDLQEDLSISPDGIVDFGVADMGDVREGKRTPIDLVVEYSKACRGLADGERFETAYKVLRARLGHKNENEVKDDDDDNDELVVVVTAGNISQAVDKTQRAILAAKRPVFVRGGRLVEPIWAKYPAAGGRETCVTTFQAMVVENMRYMVNKHGISYETYNIKEKKMKVIDPPDRVLGTLVKLGYWKFPRVSGIINAPTMRPDGSILSSRGYDAATQLWCWPGEDMAMPSVAEAPGFEEAREALDTFIELFDGFAFVGGLDRSVALAAVLGAVLRGAFDVAPMTLFLAHSSGTGKSYLVDTIATIITGQRCPVITASRNAEEMEKRLGGLLLESLPIISLDNMSFDLRSDLICQMCTQQTVKVRILGTSDTPNCDWRGLLFGTGNNIRLVGDLARRSLIGNMDAGVERPELREFKFDPIQRAFEDRGKYIWAALTIARAYLNCGEKVKCKSIGSYGQWSRFVREPLIWLGEPDPILSMEQAHADDPEREAAERLVEQWIAHLGTVESFKASDVIEVAKAVEPEIEMGVGVRNFRHVRPDFFNLLLERAGERGNIDLRKFSSWLRMLKGQIHNGHKIIVSSVGTSHGNKWKLQKLS